MTKPMATVFTRILTGRDMKVIGLRINSMAMELSSGQMEHRTRDFIRKERNTGKETSRGLIIQSTKGCSLIIIFMESEHIHGRMAEFTMDSGQIIKWKEEENLNGLTVEPTSENMLMTQSRVKARSNGQTVENT